MNARRKLVTDVTVEPVTLAEVKQWLNIETTCTEFDAMLTAMITPARRLVEDMTNYKLGVSTIEFIFNGFYSDMWLEAASLATVESVKYYDGANDIQTLDAELYEYQLIEFPAQLRAAYNVTYPVTFTRFDAVTVQVKTDANYPKPLLTALKMIIAHWFENRQDVVVGHTANQVPQTSKDLINIYKLQIFR